MCIAPNVKPVLCCADICVHEAASRALLWLQESGLARVLLPELGLETVMRIDRPARPGDTLQVCVGFVDVPKGIYKLTEVNLFASASLSSADIDDAEDKAVDQASLPSQGGTQESEVAGAVSVGEGHNAEPLARAPSAST